jgi:hypothetical protein
MMPRLSEVLGHSALLARWNFAFFTEIRKQDSGSLLLFLDDGSASTRVQLVSVKLRHDFAGWHLRLFGGGVCFLERGLGNEVGVACARNCKVVAWLRYEGFQMFRRRLKGLVPIQQELPESSDQGTDTQNSLTLDSRRAFRYRHHLPPAWFASPSAAIRGRDTQRYGIHKLVSKQNRRHALNPHQHRF